MVVLATLVLSKLFLYNTSFGNKKDRSAKIVHIVRAPDVGEKKKEEVSITALNFAHEYLPMEDIQIQKKMKRSLRAYSFSKLRTHKLHKNAATWFPKIEPILRQYGIPDDFKYLPLVESGLIEGTSHRGASGLWQFMPATARAFGLTVNARVDERQNVEKATVAACKYLKVLYREFGNWTLVAAAYNVGSGSLRRIIRNQQEDDYYKLRLNKETGSYLYKLISTKEVIEKPDQYGFRVKPPQTRLAMDQSNASSDSSFNM